MTTGRRKIEMEEAKELTSSSLSQGLTHHGPDPDDIPKSPPESPNSSTRKVTLNNNTATLLYTFPSHQSPNTGLNR